MKYSIKKRVLSLITALCVTLCALSCLSSCAKTESGIIGDCNNDGKVMVDGILVRRSEEDFITMCLPDPAMLAQMTGKDYGFESKDTCAKRFFFQLCGPRSLEVVEQAAKADLHDLEFMYLVDA